MTAYSNVGVFVKCICCFGRSMVDGVQGHALLVCDSVIDIVCNGSVCNDCVW